MDLGQLNSYTHPINWHPGWTRGERCWRCYPYGYTYVDPMGRWDVDEVTAALSRRLVLGETLVQAVNHRTIYGKWTSMTSGELFYKIGTMIPDSRYLGNLETNGELNPDITTALFGILLEMGQR